MALITLTGDSDGDLHTADLHNSKFGAIASVLNGNVDLDNLANPKSRGVFTFNSSGNNAGVSTLFEWYKLASATATTPSSDAGDQLDGSFLCLKSSWFCVPHTIQLESVNFIMFNDTIHTSGDNYTIALQVSSSNDPATATYSDIASITTDYHSASKVMEKQTPSLSSSSIASGRYIRLVFTNPTFSGTHYWPNSTSVSISYKLDHVA